MWSNDSIFVTMCAAEFCTRWLFMFTADVRYSTELQNSSRPSIIEQGDGFSSGFRDVFSDVAQRSDKEVEGLAYAVNMFVK